MTTFNVSDVRSATLEFPSAAVPSSVSISSASAASTTFSIPTTSATDIPLYRWVAVDDSDTVNIQYIGNWISIKNTTQYDSLGNYGTPYQGTLHAITDGTGSIAFTINSTRGEITGTTKIANMSGGIDPEWFCTIDGFKIMPDDPSPQAQNNWPLCEWDGLDTAKVHVITLNATSRGQTFFFDRMSYIPPIGESHGNESVIVPWSDPLIEYDSSWAGFSGTSMMTTTQGATWNFSFEGTAVEWYATLPAQFVQMRTPSSATYSIDNGTPVFFKTGSLPSISPSQFNQLQLKTPELATGTHTLTVQFLGDTSTAPLFLESLIIHNSVTADTPSGTSIGPASNSSSSPLEHHSKNAPKVGTVIGAGVAGSVVLIIFLLTIWYFIYKARRKRRLAEQLLDIDEPLPPVLRPFTLEPKDIVKDTAPSGLPHSPHTVEPVQRPICDAMDNNLKYSDPTINRNTLNAPNFQHRLQLQNASLSELDLPDPSPKPHETPIVHRDSGIRLIEGITPLEYPPVYTLQ